LIIIKEVGVLQYLEQRYKSKAVKLIGTITMLVSTVNYFFTNNHALVENS